jgi:hypothetical protein
LDLEDPLRLFDLEDLGPLEDRVVLFVLEGLDRLENQ